MFKLCLHNNLNNKLYIYIFFFCLVRGGKSLHWSAPSRRLTVDTVPLSSMGKSVGNGLPVFIWSARRMENRIIILRNFASGSERMAAGVCGHPLLHRGNLRVWSGLPEKKTDMWTWSDSPCERTLICCTAVSQVECVKSRQDSYCQTQAK